jgi:hypothetical protein
LDHFGRIVSCHRLTRDRSRGPQDVVEILIIERGINRAGDCVAETRAAPVA